MFLEEFSINSYNNLSWSHKMYSDRTNFKIEQGLLDYQLRTFVHDKYEVKLIHDYPSYKTSWGRALRDFKSSTIGIMRILSGVENLFVGRGFIFQSVKESEHKKEDLIPLVVMLTSSNVPWDVGINTSDNPEDFVLLVNNCIFTNEYYTNFRRKVFKEIVNPCVSRGIKIEIINIPMEMFYNGAKVPVFDFSTVEERKEFVELIYDSI